MQPHDGEGEIGIVADQHVEERPVDRHHLGRPDGDRRAAARAVVEERHLAEDLAGTKHLDRHAVADPHAAAGDDIGALAGLAPGVDRSRRR